jgi:TPR repeat protein
MQSQEDLLERAEQLKGMGRCQEAIDLYRKAANQDPFIYSLIGFIYHMGNGDVSKDLDAAIDCYQRGLDESMTPSLSRALLSAYCEKRFESLERCEEYLEKIAGYDHLVAQLACLWLFALRFRSERSPEEQAKGRAYGERAARMGNVHACKAMAEVYFAERKLLRASWMYSRALFSELRLRLIDPEDIRLQKY